MKWGAYFYCDDEADFHPPPAQRIDAEAPRDYSEWENEIECLAAGLRSPERRKELRRTPVGVALALAGPMSLTEINRVFEAKPELDSARWVGVMSAARVLGISRLDVYTLAFMGVLHTREIGDRTFFSRASVVAAAQKNKVKP